MGLLALVLVGCDSAAASAGPQMSHDEQGVRVYSYGALATGGTIERTLWPPRPMSEVDRVSVYAAPGQGSPRQELGPAGDMRWEAYEVGGRIGVRIHGVPAGWWYWTETQ